MTRSINTRISKELYYLIKEMKKQLAKEYKSKTCLKRTRMKDFSFVDVSRICALQIQELLRRNKNGKRR